MRLKNRYYFLLIPVLSVLFTACLGDDDEESYYSSNADFVSLTFAENDSMPGLEDAVFSLEADLIRGDSVIVNVDSLPFQTRIDSVYPTFQFRSTSSAWLIQDVRMDGLPPSKDTLYLMGSGNDTVNFKWETTVYNCSSDGTNTKSYRIKVNVHQVEPELYVWKKLNGGIAPSAEANQKAVRFVAADKFLFFTGSETETRLYMADGSRLTAESTWQDKGVVAVGNTASLKLRYMTEHAGRLYVSDNAGRLYASSDGEAWQTVYMQDVYNLLFSFDSRLWAIMNSAEDEYYLASSTDGTVWERESDLPQHREDASRMFPIDDYGVLVFRSPVGRSKMMVLGGYNKDGILSSTTWMSGDARSWEPLRDNALDAMQGAALAQYDGKVFLFGGMNVHGGIVDMKESIREGLVWNTPDTTYNVLPEDFTSRSYQSVIFDEDDQRLYFIGGKNGNSIFSDVWTAKLNRMFFEE